MKKILKISQKSNSGVVSKALGCTAHSGFCSATVNKMPLKQANVQKKSKKN
jgi:hypothetical protein